MRKDVTDSIGRRQKSVLALISLALLTPQRFVVQMIVNSNEFIPKGVL